MTPISQFQKHLKTQGALIDNPIDLLYLTGLSLSRGLLAISPSDAVLYVDGRYIADAQKNAPCAVHPLTSTSSLSFFQAANITTVEFDSTTTTYERFLSLKKLSSEIEWVPKPSLMKKRRIIKTSQEIEALKKAATLTWDGYKHIISLLKVGVSEEELALEFEFFVRKKGASGLSFDPIIAFGENSAYPHHRAGKTKLQNNQIVLIDVGAVLNKYRGDLTRVHFFGTVDAELHHMLDWTKAAQQAAINLARPGTPVGALDKAARSIFSQHNVEPLFSHGLGHGVGLETHELPSIKAGTEEQDLPLQEGMVFTVEPGLYKPGLGGVRWEDMVVVTKDGVEKLFPS